MKSFTCILFNLVKHARVYNKYDDKKVNCDTFCWLVSFNISSKGMYLVVCNEGRSKIKIFGRSNCNGAE